MMNKEKDITCAVLHVVGNKFLVCHATLSPFWSLPKGIKEDSETFVQAAVREMYEETGIAIIEDKLRYVGIFKYKKDKSMAVFKYVSKVEFRTKSMDCYTKFYSQNTKSWLKEVDSYKYVTIQEAESMLNKAQYNIVKKFIKE